MYIPRPRFSSQSEVAPLKKTLPIQSENWVHPLHFLIRTHVIDRSVVKSCQVKPSQCFFQRHSSTSTGYDTSILYFCTANSRTASNRSTNQTINQSINQRMISPTTWIHPIHGGGKTTDQPPNRSNNQSNFI